MVVSTGSVDTGTVGVYTITYTSTDTSGNTATATRTVIVVDTTSPVLTINGDNPATVELGSTYTDAGASASDLSGTITPVTSGTVDTSTIFFTHLLTQQQMHQEILFVILEQLMLLILLDQ